MSKIQRTEEPSAKDTFAAYYGLFKNIKAISDFTGVSHSAASRRFKRNLLLPAVHDLKILELAASKRAVLTGEELIQYRDWRYNQNAYDLSEE